MNDLLVYGIIISLARRDKERATLQELEAMDKDGYQLAGLRTARKPFQPRRFKFKNTVKMIFRKQQRITLRNGPKQRKYATY